MLQTSFIIIDKTTLLEFGRLGNKTSIFFFRKNSELFEPKNLQEMASVYTVSGQYVYINYHDIRLEASVEGTENSVFFDSVFMGSRSTLAKIPDNFWYHTYKGGNIRDPNQHCMVARDKTHDAPCANEYLYVCEIRDVHLRNHLENLDEQ